MAARKPSKQPVNTLRCGNIKATIWENVGEKGPFFATTFSRPFEDQSGEWRNGTSFGLNDLEALISVARGSKEWIEAHALKHCAASMGGLRSSGGFLQLQFSLNPLQGCGNHRPLQHNQSS
ncbi:MAG TPA: hypothetical protein VEI50_02440 [Nitrospiraceae bacterium]|nr:hypothetical protein [Nitrospiraceae bacterium]